MVHGGLCNGRLHHGGQLRQRGLGILQPGPGRLKQLSRKAVQALGLPIDVEYITDIEKVMSYGAMSMPAIVVNEKVVSMGKVLKAADVEKLLRKLGY